MQWFTIKEFENIKPLNLYHKEQDELKVSGIDIKNLHVLARSHYFCSKTDKNESSRYMLNISADDYYKLYVNGIFVTQGPSPAYPEHYYYNAVDITPYLKDGDNVIAVHLYYQGLINRVWNSGDNRFAVAAELLQSGAGLEKKSELAWKYNISNAYSGDTIGYETQFIENFDSRKWDENWNKEGFDDKDWESMVLAKWADYKMEKQPTAQLQIYRKKPLLQRETQKENYFVDMGSEITGSLCLKAKGKAGQKVTILCGEEADGEQTRYSMRCNCDYKEVWTLKDGLNELEPYDYKGFRYANIIVDPGVELIDVEAEIRHYPMEEACCTLDTDSAAKDIFEICKNGVRLGTQEVYVDCPTREKGQYLGDAVVTANAQAWLSGNTDMLKKCIEQFAQSTMICPGMMGVAPGAFMQEIADFSLLWSQLLMEYYRFTGDVEFLKEYYPVAEGIVKHFTQYAREDGLLYQVKDKWNLVDWPENLRDGYEFELSRPIVAEGCHNVINALYIGAVKTLEELRKLTGLKKADFLPDLNTLQTAYIGEFYKADKKLFTDTKESSHSAVHSNAYALYFDLVPQEAIESVMKHLTKDDFHCGVVLSYYILKALAEHGYTEEAYCLMMNEGEHGWINMLREGATSCYEAWGKNQKWNTSLCHPWASAPITILIEKIAGFIPDPKEKDGFRFEPHIPGEEKFFRLNLTFRGKRYEIKKENGTISYIEI